MRILIVEDSSFNAYCLQRLLETVSQKIVVRVCYNSIEAYELMSSFQPDCVILDGDLGGTDGVLCNGPALADTLWHHFPHTHIIAWTDSDDSMREAFQNVFQQHSKLFNEYSCWTKIVSQERIRKSLAYFAGDFVGANSTQSMTERHYYNSIN